jgi:hypothetical protein
LPDANTLSYFGEGEGGSAGLDFQSEFRSLKDFGILGRKEFLQIIREVKE